MDILTLISIIFLTLFILVFIVMIITYIKSRKTSKELNTSMARDIKRNPLSIVMITILFSIVTSVIFGTTNSIDYTSAKINQIYDEGNVYHASIEATRFIPDEVGETEAGINLDKFYKEQPANNLNDVVDFLYTGNDDDSLYPTMSESEIETMVKEDFLINGYNYNVAPLTPDTTSSSILHVFYLLKKSEMDISFKYQPTHFGKLGDVSLGDNGLTDNTEIKIIRDETKVSYVHNGKTIFPTSQSDVNETNIISHQFKPGIEITNDQASVGDQFYKARGFQENVYNELILFSNGYKHIFNVIDINQTPQNIVPPSFQNEVQFGEITHDMTTALVASNTRFNEITMQSGLPKFDSGDIAIFFNDVKKDNYDFNSKKYNDQIDKNVAMLEAELSTYINEVPPVSPWSCAEEEIRTSNPIVYAWNMETYYKQNASMNFSLSQQETVIHISSVIIPIFSILILLIILLFLKRRTEVNQQYNMTLKSLGYSSRQVAVSYLIFPFVILIFGWMFGMLVGQSIIQTFWMNRTQQKVSFQVEMFNDFIGSFLFLFAILVLISVISFLFVTMLLKKNIVEVMNGSTVGKPNMFVRMNAKRDKTKTKFTTSYRRSNALRQMSKSLFIFVAIATSTIVFLFGASTTNFAEMAKSSTGENFSFDYIHYGDKSVETVEASDVETYENYDFGAQSINVYVDYRGIGNKKEYKLATYDMPAKTKTYEFGNLEYETSVIGADYGIGRLWYELQQDIVGYMETESLYNKKITIEASDITQVIISALASIDQDSKLSLAQHYASKKSTGLLLREASGTLYTLMSIVAFNDTGAMEVENNSLSQTQVDEFMNKEFYVGIGTGTDPTYEDLSLTSLYAKLMDVVKSNILNILPALTEEIKNPSQPLNSTIHDSTKIEVSEILGLVKALGVVLEDHGILTNQQYNAEAFDQLSIGVGMPYYMDGQPIPTNLAPLHIPDPEVFDTYYSLKAISGESIVDNHMEYNVENSIPVYIPYSESQVSGLKEGDYFEYVVSKDLLQEDYLAAHPDRKVKLQVVGIYSSYFSLGYPTYAGGTNETPIDQSLAAKVLKTTQSHNPTPTTPDLKDQYNSTITRKWSDLSTYGTWYSEDFETADTTTWTLLNGTQIKDEPQTFFNYQNTFTAPIPFSIVPTVVEVQYKDFDATIQLFVGISFIISILVIMIITKEIIDNTKSEVSTLKAMGYGKYKSASLVAESQIISMMISAIISIPIAMALISVFENVLLVQMGLVTSFITSWATILSFLIVMMVVLAFIYIFIIFLLKNTNALLSTK